MKPTQICHLAVMRDPGKMNKDWILRQARDDKWNPGLCPKINSVHNIQDLRIDSQI